MTQDGLESKREKLEELEKSEREAQRLSEALSRGRTGSIGSPSAPRSPGAEGEDGVEAETQHPPSENYLPPHPGPNPARRKTSTPGMGLFNALSYTLHGMMDVDPETARRNGITKTRETIASVSSSVAKLIKREFDESACLSWTKGCTCRYRTSSTLTRLFKATWIVSSGRRWPIYVK